MGEEDLRGRRKARRAGKVSYYGRQKGKYVNETEIKRVKGCQEGQGEGK